jgi:hypothetical protein
MVDLPERIHGQSIHAQGDVKSDKPLNDELLVKVNKAHLPREAHPTPGLLGSSIVAPELLSPLLCRINTLLK